MRLRVFLVVLMTIFVVFGTLQAKTLISLPGEVALLPDYPNMATSEYYDFGIEGWDTAITTEWCRYKFLFGSAGWTINKQRWVVGAGVDIQEMFQELYSIGWTSKNLLANYPLTSRLFLTYGLDNDLLKRSWTAGIGVDLFEIRNDK